MGYLTCDLSWGPHILALGAAWGKEGGPKLELFPCWSFFNVLWGFLQCYSSGWPYVSDTEMLVYWQFCTWCCGHVGDHGHVSALLIQDSSSKSHFEKAFCPTARPGTMVGHTILPSTSPTPQIQYLADGRSSADVRVNRWTDIVILQVGLNDVTEGGLWAHTPYIYLTQEQLVLVFLGL